MHVVEDNIAGDKSPLPREPKHGVCIGIALEILKDLYFRILKLNKVIFVPADGNHMGCCVRAQKTFPFVYFLLIDLVDSIHDVGIRQYPYSRIRFLEHLQTEKMIPVLMSDVDDRQRFMGCLDCLQYLFSIRFCQLCVNQYHLVAALDDDGVSPELIAGGCNYRNRECLLAVCKRRLCESE